MKAKPLIHGRGLVLLLLSQRQGTGADLLRRANEIDRISSAAVYGAITQLVVDGLVRQCGTKSRPGSRQGARYVLTAAGRELAAQLRAIVATAAAAFPVAESSTRSSS